MADPLIIGGVVKLGMSLVDRLFPNQQERDRAKLELLAMEQAGDLKELEIRMSAIIAEASSTDKWTSRARPGIFYVAYTLILSAIPFSLLYAIQPDMGRAVTEGFQGWLTAIPGDLYDMLTIALLGYTGARSYEKAKGVAK